MSKSLTLVLAAGYLMTAGAITASAAQADGTVQVNRAAKADKLPMPVAETIIIKTEPASLDFTQ
jgi:hypothetical protein